MVFIRIFFFLGLGAVEVSKFVGLGVLEAGSG
ncbi:MAG: hypothetical protein FD143_2920 [Ignavibacteria bacterium]|nr:MAG: hypothetical protein FD143_2920 [Ignavibacteria bacterium]